VNNRMGNLFASYDYFYSWRKISGNESREQNGIHSLHSMVQGLFHPVRLLDVLKNFIFFPDTSKKEIKVGCRYPQYYAARKLFFSIKQARVNHMATAKAVPILARPVVAKVTPCSF
jgi:hypothetical protein